jgi:hypothetical protein
LEDWVGVGFVGNLSDPVFGWGRLGPTGVSGWDLFAWSSIAKIFIIGRMLINLSRR